MKRMFRAYFELSMDLVRDVVRGMEQGLMDDFDDQGVKPVSSVFTAAIQSGGEEWNKETESVQSSPGDVRLSPQSSKGSPTLNSPTANVMAVMSDEAIEELVEKTFRDKEFLTLADFSALVERDHNLLAWFEALGSVF